MLSEIQIAGKLEKLPQWICENGCIKKTFKFNDFIGAFGVMTQIALVAESMQHHPTWTNTFNNLQIELTTHDEGGVTEKDIKLALAIEKIATPRG